MGLTNRQAEAVNKIIQEEVEGFMAIRRERERLLAEGRYVEGRLLREAGPDPKRVDKAVLAQAIDRDGDLEDLAMDLSGQFAYQFAEKMKPILLRLLEQYAMDVTDKGHQMTPGWTLDGLEELEDLDDDITDAQMECAVDISQAFNKLIHVYAEKAAEQTAKAREEY
jgi:hypothetical protein